MPRGVKGSGPQKDKASAVVEEVEQDQREAVIHDPDAPGQDALDALNAQTQQEFNEFVTMLARNAAEQVVQGLDERIRDLEQVVQALVGKTGADNPDPSARSTAPDIGEPHYDVPEYSASSLGLEEVPEYVQEHQSEGGTPWYRV